MCDAPLLRLRASGAPLRMGVRRTLLEMLKLRRSIFFAPLNLFAVIVLASIPLFGVNYSWGNWQPASCMPNHCFCEALRDGFIRQPINAYSNLAFVLVGW